MMPHHLKSCVALFYIHRHDRSTPEKFQEMLIRKILDSIQDPSDLVELILSIPVPADHPRRSDMFLDAREKYTLIKKLADEFNKSSNKPNKSSIIGAILLGAACLNEDGTIAQGDPTCGLPILGGKKEK